MEPWVVVLVVVAMVALTALKWVARRRAREAARRSGRKPTAAGAAGMAAAFFGFAVLVYFLDGDDDGRRGLPDWVAIPFFIVGGLYFAGVAVKLWRKDAMPPPRGGAA